MPRCGETHGVLFIRANGEFVPHPDPPSVWSPICSKVKGFATWDAHGIGIFQTKSIDPVLLSSAFNCGLPSPHVAAWKTPDDSFPWDW